MNTPQFASRDPLQAEFWDQRFAQAFTPWDKGGLPQQWQSFVANHAPMHCLIPGCGKGWEVAQLVQAGWQVSAIDFAAQAVSAAHQQLQQLAPDQSLAQYVELADFFTYTPRMPVACIYERAFLCALPPARWPSLVARWAQLLPPGGLLAGYFFIDQESASKGPPFCIAQSELTALLSPHFTCLEDEAVPDSIPVFLGRERWQVWRRK